MEGWTLAGVPHQVISVIATCFINPGSCCVTHGRSISFQANSRPCPFLSLKPVLLATSILGLSHYSLTLSFRTGLGFLFSHYQSSRTQRSSFPEAESLKIQSKGEEPSNFVSGKPKVPQGMGGFGPNGSRLSKWLIAKKPLQRDQKVCFLFSVKNHHILNIPTKSGPNKKAWWAVQTGELRTKKVLVSARDARQRRSRHEEGQR